MRVKSAVLRPARVLLRLAFAGSMHLLAASATLAGSRRGRQFGWPFADIMLLLLHVISCLNLQREMVGKNGARAYRQRDANESIIS